MQFNSLSFIVFAPFAVLLSYALPQKLRKYLILLASIFFYLSFGIPAIFVLAAIWFVTAVSAYFIHKTRAKPVLVIALFIIIGLLVSFRFMNAAENTWFGRTVSFSLFVPIGISFYSLNAVGYLTDLYKGKMEQPMSAVATALFLTFFPTVTSGPILRAKEFSRQVENEVHLSYSRIRKGFLWILWGYFLKLVISERCALFANTVYGNTELIGLPVLMAVIAYSLQIYSDFAGYSLIAKGLAYSLGYEIPDNFKQPYLSESIREFWRRWHISLSTWLRDYVYIPLGGSRCTKLRKYFNLMITFLVSGFWHGKGMTFLIWGGLHGLYQIAEDMISGLKKKTDHKSDLRLLKIFLTFLLVSIAWVFFRSFRVLEALDILRRSVIPAGWGSLFSETLYTWGLDVRNFWILMGSILLMTVVDAFEYRKHSVMDWVVHQNIVVRIVLLWILIFMITISLNISAAEFIYMQF